MDTALTKSEQTELARLCKVVDEGLTSFLAVGTALVEINEGRLYRESHETFEAFVKDRWGISRRRAYQLMEAAEIKAEMCTNGSHQEIAEEITSERQIRELSRVGTEAIPEVVERVAEKCKADGVKPTAKVIREVVNESLGKPDTKTDPKQQDSFDREQKHLDLARKHLSGLRLALSNLGAGKRFDEYWATVEDWING